MYRLRSYFLHVVLIFFPKVFACLYYCNGESMISICITSTGQHSIKCTNMEAEMSSQSIPLTSESDAQSTQSSGHLEIKTEPYDECECECECGCEHAEIKKEPCECPCEPGSPGKENSNGCHSEAAVENVKVSQNFMTVTVKQEPSQWNEIPGEHGMESRCAQGDTDAVQGSGNASSDIASEIKRKEYEDKLVRGPDKDTDYADAEDDNNDGCKSMHGEDVELRSKATQHQVEEPGTLQLSMVRTEANTDEVVLQEEHYQVQQNTSSSCNELEQQSKNICKECGKTLMTAQGLKRHIKTHSGEKPHTCPVCGKTFSRAANMRQHMTSHSDERPHKCPICGKGFSLSSVLRNHITTHTGNRPYACDDCEKTFLTAENLRIHKLIHTGERPHCCSECPKTFIQSADLKRHMATHRGDKPFCCPHCTKTFTRSSHLKQHQVTHTDERPHRCDCGQAFRLAHHLRQHQILHSGHKPYSCPECDKTFTQASGLSQHVDVHHLR